MTKQPQNKRPKKALHMRDFLIRCSSLGKIMTEPMTVDEKLRTPEVEEILAKRKREEWEKAIITDLLEKTLSAGAKTYIRQLVAQEIFSVEFEISGKALEKGLQCEDESIGMLNRVRGLCLSKNTERRTNGWLTGECDLFDKGRRRGHDIKTSWSLATFPIVVADCYDKLYEWQVRGYMMLWDADEWEVDYCMVNTPEKLIGYEPMQLHFVDHIPEHMRVTSWFITRDMNLERLIGVKVKAAREYAAEVLREFDRTHALSSLIDAGADWVSDATVITPEPNPIPPKTVAKLVPPAPARLPDLFV